jgi:hypothetical protein
MVGYDECRMRFPERISTYADGCTPFGRMALNEKDNNRIRTYVEGVVIQETKHCNSSGGITTVERIHS